MKWLVLVLALSACEKSKPGPPPDPCAPAAEHAASIVGAQEMVRPKKEVEELEMRASKFERALDDACRGDKWPADVTTCLMKAAKRDDIQPCWATLPADQRANLDGILDAFYHSRGGI